MKCPHTQLKEVDYEEWDDDKCDFKIVKKLEPCSTFEDVDTHRMKCKLCGKIDYYSNSARAHYEKGIESHWVKFSNTTKKLEVKKGLAIGAAITVGRTPDGRKFLRIPMGRTVIQRNVAGKRIGKAQFVFEKFVYHWGETPVKLGAKLTFKELKELKIQ